MGQALQADCDPVGGPFGPPYLFAFLLTPESISRDPSSQGHGVRPCTSIATLSVLRFELVGHNSNPDNDSVILEWTYGLIASSLNLRYGVPTVVIGLH